MSAPPKVFLDYTQQELDDAYEQRLWAPNYETVSARNLVLSETARAQFRTVRASYGPSAEEWLEIFPAGAGGAPVQFFIHGGRWRAPVHDGFVFAAPTFLAAGACFIAARFATLPGARLPEIAAQLRRAIVCVYRNAASFGADRDRLYLSGHSSGGHLAAVLLTTDWRSEGLPPDAIKGGLCVSGIYDLRPVLLSNRRDYVRLDAAEEAALSPVRHASLAAAPIIVAHGDRESPEFQRHARSFADALAAAGRPATSLVMSDLNHFEGIASLAEPSSPLARAALRQMRLPPDAG